MMSGRAAVTSAIDGVAPARQADQDEPLAWPSSDRQKMETTANRIEQGEPEQAREERPEEGGDLSLSPSTEGQIELPAPGYPYSQEAVRSWFRSTYSRVPSERELGALMNAMAQRDFTPPHVGPEADPHGWETTPSGPPATRR